jgi:hypothetical protein
MAGARLVLAPGYLDAEAYQDLRERNTHVLDKSPLSIRTSASNMCHMKQTNKKGYDYPGVTKRVVILPDGALAYHPSITDGCCSTRRCVEYYNREHTMQIDGMQTSSRQRAKFLLLYRDLCFSSLR